MSSKLKVLDLFSGIGGFSLGLERTGGFETVAFCEIEPFCQKVLRKHWPNVPIYEDIRELTADRLAADGIAIDVITGGFPCQDISKAGNRTGINGTRSGLWAYLCQIISDIRPKYTIVENVAALLSGPTEQPGEWFGIVLRDLASIGFDAEWHSIPASAFGAPHVRDRVWIICYPQSQRFSETRKFRHIQSKERIFSVSEKIHNSDYWIQRIQRCWSKKVQRLKGFSWCEDVRGPEDLRGRSDIPEPLFWGASDGISDWVDRTSAIGNAVVPQIPELIGYAILEAEGQMTSIDAA